MSDEMYYKLDTSLLSLPLLVASGFINYRLLPESPTFVLLLHCFRTVLSDFQLSLCFPCSSSSLAVSHLSSYFGSVFLFQPLSFLSINSIILDSFYLFKQDVLGQSFRNVILAPSVNWLRILPSASLCSFSPCVWALFAYTVVTYGSVS